jgi:branched-chain amino acid transport system permease protein
MIPVVQTLITGTLVGGLYAVFSLGLTLPWGLLRVLNFAHFAYVFLFAYLTYELAAVHHLDPLLALAVTLPLGAVVGLLTQALISRASLDTFGTLIATFGLFLVLQAAMTMYWTNDLVRIPSTANPYFVRAWHIGPYTIPFVYTCALVAAVVLCVGSYLLLERSFTGKAIRAAVQDPQIAAAFGVNRVRVSYLIATVAGISAAVAGGFVAMLFALTPSGAQSWVAVVFASVLLGGLGNPRGILGAAIIVGIAEALTQRYVDPTLAKLTPLALLTVVLLIRPTGLFRPAVRLLQT